MSNAISDKTVFINWLLWMKKTAPDLYALFKVQYPEIINGLKDSRLGFSLDWSSILDFGKKFVETALPIYSQQKQFKNQLELAKLQLQAPAGFTRQPQPTTATAGGQQVLMQSTAQANYPKAVAVPTTTPNTSYLPVSVANAGEPLVIRIDKSILPEVKKEAAGIRIEDLIQYAPYALGGIALLLVMRNR